MTTAETRYIAVQVEISRIKAILHRISSREPCASEWAKGLKLVLGELAFPDEASDPDVIRARYGDVVGDIVESHRICRRKRERVSSLWLGGLPVSFFDPLMAETNPSRVIRELSRMRALAEYFKPRHRSAHACLLRVAAQFKDLKDGKLLTLREGVDHDLSFAMVRWFEQPEEPPPSDIVIRDFRTLEYPVLNEEALETEDFKRSPCMFMRKGEAILREIDELFSVIRVVEEKCSPVLTHIMQVQLDTLDSEISPLDIEQGVLNTELEKVQTKFGRRFGKLEKTMLTNAMLDAAYWLYRGLDLRPSRYWRKSLESAGKHHDQA